MRQETITSIDKLLEFITELYDEHSYRLWYRGVANNEWKLVPSIQRVPNFMSIERFITNDFYIKAKQIMENPPDKKSYAAWMSLMQHFGLPTRLLDWSASPLIAMFFAVEQHMNYPDKDACIWVLAPGKLNEREGFKDCIYPVDSDTSQNMLLPAFKEKGHTIELENKIIACHSTENNLRMYSQQANFTIHNSNRKLEDVCLHNMLYKLTIPKDVRASLLFALKLFGITESFIYPDLDHISKDLKQEYNIN